MLPVARKIVQHSFFVTNNGSLGYTWYRDVKSSPLRLSFTQSSSCPRQFVIPAFQFAFTFCSLVFLSLLRLFLLWSIFAAVLATALRSDCSRSFLSCASHRCSHSRHPSSLSSSCDLCCGHVSDPQGTGVCPLARLSDAHGPTPVRGCGCS